MQGKTRNSSKPQQHLITGQEENELRENVNSFKVFKMVLELLKCKLKKLWTCGVLKLIHFWAWGWNGAHFSLAKLKHLQGSHSCGNWVHAAELKTILVYSINTTQCLILHIKAKPVCLYPALPAPKAELYLACKVTAAEVTTNPYHLTPTYTRKHIYYRVG